MKSKKTKTKTKFGAANVYSSSSNLIEYEFMSILPPRQLPRFFFVFSCRNDLPRVCIKSLLAFSPHEPSAPFFKVLQTKIKKTNKNLANLVSITYLINKSILAHFLQQLGIDLFFTHASKRLFLKKMKQLNKEKQL